MGEMMKRGSREQGARGSKIGKFKSFLLCLAFLFAGFFTSNAFCEEDAQALSVHGFFLFHTSGRTAGKGPDGNDFLSFTQKLRLEAASTVSETYNSSFLVKLDVLHDSVTKEKKLDVREAYLDFSLGKADVRAGKQILTWGVGDLIFINDVFPKNLNAFFKGEPSEYLKKGETGVFVGLPLSPWNMEAVFIPSFEPDETPSAKQFYMVNPFSALPQEEIKKTAQYKNAQITLRAYANVKNTDVSLYFYKGFYKSPSMMPDNLAAPAKAYLFYPSLLVYGASAQKNFMDGVLSLEAGYTHSKDDSAGTNPFVPNSSTRFLAGYQRSLKSDLHFGMQYYGEWMKDYNAYKAAFPAGFPAQRKLRDVVTARITKTMNYETQKLSLFSFYSPSDGDFYVIPEVSRKFSDVFTVTAGGNFFGGSEETFFGQFNKNDSAYVYARYDF